MFRVVLSAAVLSIVGLGCDPKPAPAAAGSSGTPRGSVGAGADPVPTASASSTTPPPKPQRDGGLPYAQAFDAKRLEADIRFVAKPRPPGSAHHGAVREACAKRFKDAGLDVFRQPFAGGENIVGTKKGKTDKRVILSAHYDHIAGCSGADDNATGVAIVWEAARVLSKASFEHTLVLACWDDEESGLYGSAAYAARCKQQKQDVALMISLDGVGFTNDEPGSQRMPPGFDKLFPAMSKQLTELEFRGNFIAVIGDTSAAPGLHAIQRYAKHVKLPVLGDALGVMQRLALLDAARSDHASFWVQGYPALLITDTANFRSPYYHCMRGDDAVDTLDMDFTARVGRSVVGGVADLLQSNDATP